ncbi:MAG TPA: collagen-like protein [Puia sp.]
MRTPISFLFVLLLFAAMACSKTGPTGPQGNAGVTGPSGPAGPTGPIGTANVWVDTFSVVNTQWLYNSGWYYSTGNGGYTEYFTRYRDQTFSKITQGILDTGMVMVYFTPNQNDTNQWVPLTYSFLAFSGAYYFNYGYETMPGKVRLHYWYTANGSGTPPTTLSTDVIATHKYKVVVVASGAVATAMKKDPTIGQGLQPTGQ